MGGHVRKQMLWGLIFVGFVLSACGVGEKLREYGVRVKPAVNAPMELAEDSAQTDPKPEASAEAPKTVDDPQACSANDQVRVDVSDAENSDSDSDAICKYQVVFTNTGSETVVVHLKKRLDIEGEGTESVWKNHTTLNPGATVTLRYRTTYLKESGIRYVEALEGTAAILSSEPCVNTFEHDTAARESISVPVAVPCPIE